MPIKHLLGYAAISLPICLLTSSILFDRGSFDALAGWAAASCFHLLGDLVFRRSIGKDTAVFLGMALGMILSRLFGLIILLVIVLVGGFFWLGPFATGLLTAYLIGAWMEVYRLYQSGKKDTHHG